MVRFALILGGLVAACAGDETLTGYVPHDTTWSVQEIAGQPFAGAASLSFPEAGKIAGKAPCNQFAGRITTPYPWFEVRDMAVTRMACPDLPLEDFFFETLAQMTLAEVSGNILILSDELGTQIVLTAQE